MNDHPHHFDETEREAVYRAIRERRDMRHFQRGGRVPEVVLQRLLAAAHQAPSVGLMQPWRIIRIRNPALREAIHALVNEERRRTAEALGVRGEEFLRLKVEGIREAAELLAVVLAPDDGTVFGRRTLPREMALCSAACAIQNLWLASRAENLGMGWVSLFDPQALAERLHLPEGALAIALLCLGPVEGFYPRPMLELEGWRQARPLTEMVFEDRWPETQGSGDGPG